MWPNKQNGMEYGKAFEYFLDNPECVLIGFSKEYDGEKPDVLIFKLNNDSPGVLFKTWNGSEQLTECPINLFIGSVFFTTQQWFLELLKSPDELETTFLAGDPSKFKKV